MSERPDFEAMSDLELRRYKNAQNKVIQEARANMIAAQVVLERLRAEADETWAQQVAAEAVVDAASTIIESPPASASGRAEIH